MPKKPDGRRHNQPPSETRFKPGKSGNPNGRPKKKKSTFDDEIKRVFGAECQVNVNGKIEHMSVRQAILKQIALKAAKGDPKMIKLSIPFMKTMDDAPEFEILPEDRKVIADFRAQFSEDGSTKNE